MFCRTKKLRKDVSKALVALFLYDGISPDDTAYEMRDIAKEANNLAKYIYLNRGVSKPSAAELPLERDTDTNEAGSCRCVDPWEDRERPGWCLCGMPLRS